jgi:aspartyl-tRNA(Asn)/glutamyl-tRNA(Gln) amidotransferase subunit B
MQDKVKAAAKNLISGATGDWEVIVGLEVHAQAGASTEFGGEPNNHVSLNAAMLPVNFGRV